MLCESSFCPLCQERCMERPLLVEYSLGQWGHVNVSGGEVGTGIMVLSVDGCLLGVQSIQ